MDVSRYGGSYDLTPPSDEESYDKEHIYESSSPGCYKKVSISRFGGPDVLTVSYNQPLPELKKTDVRVRVLATSVSTVDTLIRRGLYSNVRKKPPFVPGFDMVGLVEEIGSNVTNVQEGQYVAGITTTSSYSEYAIVSEDGLTIIPSDIDPAEAVSLIQAFVTAYQMLTRSANVKPGQSVLINDVQGAIGKALVQLGVQMGVKMYGVAPASSADEVASFGCYPIIIDHEKKHIIDQMKNLEPNGVDIVFDPTGRGNLHQSFRVLTNKGGIIVTSKSSTKKKQLFDGLRNRFRFLLPFMCKAQTYFYSIDESYESHHEWFQSDLTKLFQLLKEKKIKPPILKKMDLEEARNAHEVFESKNVEGEIVLLVH